jgi:hypothetical protein
MFEGPVVRLPKTVNLKAAQLFSRRDVIEMRGIELWLNVLPKVTPTH